jgi:hypothetical protein
VLAIVAEYDFFISIYNVDGNHFTDTIGLLCDGTLRFIWSVTVETLEGSCNADINVGWIYLISFFYVFLFFFFDVCPN